ncbi:glycosyltransferase family 2 protein [Nocardioides jishulii]|uniref:Glycosyltransferase family 2 protein n=1 Tax=Nocardioides jishulii TaxID=2575440 RepID=A0A4U2YIZ4_9ACTN|nr:glycosyltransferase family 2 protein [Nocardioides jishulii]QCX28186.1 hypothetical protein FCL41_12150 [Nocardioides jishulii]TKI60850.1 hypothetical protein FC770_15220 [Nocardioides jishulii]
MIVTVSTVKDHLSNVQRFVEGNLDGGVDHMVVFLDARAPKVRRWLDSRPEVTAVVADRPWWGGQRPALLNRRQNINANMARVVLADLGWAQWLFHVDADEVLRLDRDQLARVPAGEPAVGVPPLEVVSVAEPDGPPTLFKRLLDDDQLHLLTALGLLAEPTNSRYFRSHVAGKVGVRPGAEVWLGIHKATDATGRRLTLALPPGQEMLHYEAFSREDFVRKWVAMVGSGPNVNFGAHRMGLAKALRALVDMELDDETRARYLARFYDLHMADPADDLEALGLLEHRPPMSHGHQPQVLDEARRRELRTALEAWRTQDKTRLVPPKDPTKGDAARGATGSLTEKVRSRLQRKG